MFLFPFVGLVITGGSSTMTRIETFPADDPSCNIPPFPEPGNLSSFYSPPKGDLATPSLSSTMGGNLSRAVGTRPRLLASLGAVGKMSGLTTQH